LAATIGVDLAAELPSLDAALTAATGEATDDTVGALLLAAVGLARSTDVDAEAALRLAAIGLRSRAQAVETAAAP
jgi:uncharacterized protein YabN with tetrapyrrole methylase and pyrophosphatase domain